MKIRLGIVGLGDAWETRHRPALRALSDRFEVRAVCCDVLHLAETAARDFQAVAVDGFRALCSRDDIDAVMVLSTNLYGHLPILAACDQGKAVYTAAAMDLTDTAEARQLRERVEQSGVAFTAEFPRRLAPATIRLKELIATRLGQPKLLFCHRRSRVPAVGAAGKPIRHSPTMTRELMEQVDWCRYVVGKDPTSVIGVGHLHRPHETAEDYHMLSLSFSPKDIIGAGPIAQISSSRYMSSAWPEAVSFRPPAELQVSCERGIAFVDLPATLIWFDEAGRHLEPLDDERPMGERLLMQFYRAVTSLVRKVDDLDDTYQALRVVIAAQGSFLQGERVLLDEGT